MEKLTFLEHLVSLKPVVGEPQYLESKEVKRVEKPKNCVSENNEKSGIGWAVEPELTALGKNGGIDDAWGRENKILISEDLERALGGHFSMPGKHIKAWECIWMTMTGIL